MARCSIKSLRFGRKHYRLRLEKLQKMFCNSISPNVTGLTLALSWPDGYLIGKRFPGRIPRKFVLHGLHVECKKKTPIFHWNGKKKKSKKVRHLSPSEKEEAEKAKQKKFLKYIRRHKIESRLKNSWSSFTEGKESSKKHKKEGKEGKVGKDAETRFWMDRWYKHGCKTGLKLIDFLKLGLYLRRLFTAGLNLKVNMPMKVKTLIECIKYHLRANLDLDVTPRIKCQFVKQLLIPRPTQKVQRMIFRRRLYVLEEIQLSVDPKTLEFVNATTENTYQGSFKEKSLVILPYLKSRYQKSRHFKLFGIESNKAAFNLYTGIQDR